MNVGALSTNQDWLVQVWVGGGNVATWWEVGEGLVKKGWSPEEWGSLAWSWHGVLSWFFWFFSFKFPPISSAVEDNASSPSAAWQDYVCLKQTARNRGNTCGDVLSRRFVFCLSGRCLMNSLLTVSRQGCRQSQGPYNLHNRSMLKGQSIIMSEVGREGFDWEECSTIRTNVPQYWL